VGRSWTSRFSAGNSALLHRSLTLPRCVIVQPGAHLPGSFSSIEPKVPKTPRFPLLQVPSPAPPYKGTPAGAVGRALAQFTFHVCVSGKEGKQAFHTTMLGGGKGVNMKL
jgi:hypothetical protein